MTGHRPFRELLEKMSPERRAHIKAMADEMRAEIRAGTVGDMQVEPDPYDPEFGPVPAHERRA